MKKILIGTITIIVFILLIFVFINFTKNTKKDDKKVFNIECSNSNCKKEVKGSTEESNSNISSNELSNSNITSNSISNSNVTSDINSNSNNSSNIVTSNITSNNNGSTTTNVVASNSNKSNKNESSNVPTNIEDEYGKVTISDSVEVWSQQEELKIFDVDKIKPGDNGVYEFEINNNTNKSAKYKLVFDEINVYHVNLMYKLKRNNEYVAGDENTWVKYNKMNLGDQILEKGNKDSYVLEWRWVDAPNDTEVGSTEGATYTLKVGIQGYKMQNIDKKVKGASENPLTIDNIELYIGLLIMSFMSIIVLFNTYRKNNI